MGACRRMSSRLAGVGASAAMCGAVSASKRVTAAAAVASWAVAGLPSLGAPGTVSVCAGDTRMQVEP